MEIITSADIFAHYRIKLSEACGCSESILSVIESALDSVGRGWKGSSADSCRLRLEELEEELKKCIQTLEDAKDDVYKIEAASAAAGMI